MAKSKGKTVSQIVSESRQELVDQLIQKMKDGVSPVREMWDSVSTYGLPNNPISGARYQGVNLLRLLIASAVGKYEDSRWMTLKQASYLSDTENRACWCESPNPLKIWDVSQTL